MATLFAATIGTQTITLISVVEEVRPSFSLEVENVANGYVISNKGSEAVIGTLNAQENVSAKINVWQTLSRFKGSADVNITISELHYEDFSTKGMKVSGCLSKVDGREGYISSSENEVRIRLDYCGITVFDSSVAEIFIDYNGDSSLPNGEYVSYITMSYVVE